MDLVLLLPAVVERVGVVFIAFLVVSREDLGVDLQD